MQVIARTLNGIRLNISLSHTCEEDKLNLQEDGCHPESDALLSGTRVNFSELVHHELILAIQHKCQWTTFYDHMCPEKCNKSALNKNIFYTSSYQWENKPAGISILQPTCPANFHSNSLLVFFLLSYLDSKRIEHHSHSLKFAALYVRNSLGNSIS